MSRKLPHAGVSGAGKAGTYQRLGWRATVDSWIPVTGAYHISPTNTWNGGGGRHLDDDPRRSERVYRATKGEMLVVSHASRCGKAEASRAIGARLGPASGRKSFDERGAACHRMRSSNPLLSARSGWREPEFARRSCCRDLKSEGRGRCEAEGTRVRSTPLFIGPTKPNIQCNVLLETRSQSLA